MPRVVVSVLEGMTLEKKRELAKDVTELIVKKLNVPPEAVSVVIEERSRENVAHGGKLFADS